MGLFSREPKFTFTAAPTAGRLRLETLEERATPATLITPGQTTGTAADADVSDEILAISADGKSVLFASKAANIVTGATDNNADFDLFWRDLSTNTTKLITAQAGTLNAIGFGLGASTVPLANRAVMSKDGQRVAFVSGAQVAAVTGDPGTVDQLNSNDVFWWRADTGATKLVSIRSGSNAAVGNSAGIDAIDPAISDDGSFVAYGTTLEGSQIDFSKAIDNGNTTYDLFLRTMTSVTPQQATTAITRVAGTADLVGQYGNVDRPVGNYLSGDGRFAVYATTVPASTITTVADLANTSDVFIRDNNLNTAAGVAVVSLALDGNALGATTGQSAQAPIISPTGSTVLFTATALGGSDAKQLVTGYINKGAPTDLYARIAPFALTAGTKLVSAINGATAVGGNGFLQSPSAITNASYATTTDGLSVVFVSTATNLVDSARDSNGAGLDIFIRNLSTNTTEFVSVGKDGRTGTTPSDRPTMSGDGKLVTFISASPELGVSVADTNGVADAFLRDRTNNVTRTVSTTAAGLATGDGAATAIRISNDGKETVFVSKAKNMQSSGNLTTAVQNLYSQSLPLGSFISTANKVVTASGSPDGQFRTFAVDANGRLNSVGTPLVPFNTKNIISRSASGDVNGDGIADIVAVVGPGGGSLVRVIDGSTSNDLISATSTYEPTFTGGLFVATADLDRDGKAEIILSPDVGGGGRVQVFSVSSAGLSLRLNFFGIDDTAFRGGARVAAGDLNNDGRPEIVVGAGFGGGPRVAVYDGAKLFTATTTGTPDRLFNDFFAFPGEDATRLRNGVYVAIGDVNGDGSGDMIFGGGPGGGPRVYVLDGALMVAKQLDTAYAKPVANFFAFDSAQRGGVRVAAKDLDGDAKLDLVIGSGERTASSLRTYLSKNLPTNGADPVAFEALDPFGSPSLTAGVFVG
ncbi:MAG: FG-GAP-like repeat-containing protein [Gemmataceae bacterium]